MKLRAAGVSWRRAGEEIIVLDLDGAEYFALNASGALLWERLAGSPATREELIELLASSYAIGPSQADADVAAFLDTLVEHRLVDG